MKDWTDISNELDLITYLIPCGVTAINLLNIASYCLMRTAVTPELTGEDAVIAYTVLAAYALASLGLFHLARRQCKARYQQVHRTSTEYPSYIDISEQCICLLIAVIFVTVGNHCVISIPTPYLGEGSFLELNASIFVTAFFGITIIFRAVYPTFKKHLHHSTTEP